MLSYTDLKPGVIFVRKGEPYKVLEYDFVRMQAQKPTVQLKLKNLLTGKIVQMGAQQSDSFEEAEIESLPVQFIYSRNDEFWFHPVGDPSGRFLLKEDLVGDASKFLKGGVEVSAQKFDEKIVAIELPIKVDLKVKEAPPSIKGNTSGGGTKAVVLETGVKVNTPLFINTGDVIRVNTSNGEYVERVEKN
jgi:elongation factor P